MNQTGVQSTGSRRQARRNRSTRTKASMSLPCGKTAGGVAGRGPIAPVNLINSAAAGL
jgi:hypothetical protein